MHYLVKTLLIVVLSLSAISFIDQTQEELPLTSLNDAETSANLDDTQLKKIRNVIKKAGNQFHNDYDMMASFIQGQLNASISTLWNVMVFSRSDADRRFISTLSFYDKKKYYEVNEPDNYTFSVRILQTNDTDHQVSSQNQQHIKEESAQTLPETASLSGLTFTKKKSVNLTSAQEAGIDLAVTTAYTWNKNIKDFTSVAQKLTETNLNQNWQVLTRFQSLDSTHFGFKYSAVYDQWIEYIGYGLGSYVLHVYLFRNYISG